ncbi:MAG: adenylate/guanylate cyclase domain-containing protein [Cyclobacteriaceae bacterium]|nr:adenylate/guanylate cyclase domain-containing protein [Cyclobacteriaceae bacterium]
MLAPAVKRNLFRIVPFGLIWMIFGLLYTLVERAILGDLTYYPSTGNPYNFSSNLVLTPLLSLVIGMLAGATEVLYFSKRFKEKGLVWKIAFKTLIYVFIMFFFLCVTSIISNSIELQKGLFSEEVLSNLWIFILSPAFWILELYVGFIMIIALFFAEVSDNLGQQVLANFLTGKYHAPQEEQRIFMFLDMKSSTTIAEKLGHVQYFKMLKAYYEDLSASIIQYEGQIYQYVGDEVVITWNLKSPENSVHCFFQMKEILKEQAASYQSRYQVVPSFKAGLHVGKVTTGELGVIKKDIAFSGDVLNTAARIQSLCNQYHVDLLISGDLLQRLKLPAGYEIQDLGS